MNNETINNDIILSLPTVPNVPSYALIQTGDLSVLPWCNFGFSNYSINSDIFHIVLTVDDS